MTTMNLEEQVKILIELQGLDTHIFRAIDALESAPLKTRELDEQFKAKADNLKKIEDRVKSLQLKRKEKEGEMDGKEGTIKKYQSQLYQVKTNKEYKALEEEIGRAKADNSVIEEDIIRILDEIDKENQLAAKEKELLKSEEKKLAEDKKRLADEAERAKGELEVLKKQRQELAAKVDKAIMGKYDRLVNSRDGLAIVSIKDDACQGCFRILPPQVMNEVRMKSELVFCENCARILYIEE